MATRTRFLLILTGILSSCILSSPLWAQVNEEEFIRKELGIINDQGIVNSNNYGENDPFTNSADIADPLYINQNDVYFVKADNGRFIDMFIRRKEGAASVLLMSDITFNDSNNKPVSTGFFSLRSKEYNMINGDEVRVYNNYLIGKRQGLFFLIDSNPTPFRLFGWAWHVRIPSYVVYGYTYDNYGQLRVDHGSKIIVRSFSRPYADYHGRYRDNVIYIKVNQQSNQGYYLPTLYEERELRSDDGQYVSLTLTYKDNNQYFRYFIYKDASVDNNYREITFMPAGYKEEGRAQLHASIYQQGIGRIIKATLFFKKSDKERTIFINAYDSQGNKASNDLRIIIPPKGTDFKLPFINEDLRQPYILPDGESVNNRWFFEDDDRWDDDMIERNW